MQRKIDPNIKIWEQEATKLPWKKKWSQALSRSKPFAKWFVGGEIDVCEACIDANLAKGKSNKTAIIWESENGQKESLTYRDLGNKVDIWADVLNNLKVKKGDFVTIYMPLIPEAVCAMLACTKLGAVHNVVFAGFSSQALSERINETQSKVVITADYSFRRGKKINLKQTVDQSIKSSPCVETVLFFRRTKDKLEKTNVDVDFNLACHDIKGKTKPVRRKATDPLFILYTSGTTGKPKGIMHETGGYLTHVFASIKQAFGIKPSTVFWCTADIGWITGHSYVIYGPLMHGATTFMYEGVPDYPDPGKWWELIQKYKINALYTSPTVIRMLMKEGRKWPNRFNLESLKILGTVGEPINPKAWQWFFDVIGKKRLPIIDTWWQTETGGFMISPQAKTPIDKLKPGSAYKPLPGISAEVFDKNGRVAKLEEKGYLVITNPWPGMMTTIYKNPKKYQTTYWSKFKNAYFTGDYAVKDKDGYFYILGRADEIIVVAGHNISTSEIENAATSLPFVAEVAAVGIADPIKGQQIALFVSLNRKNIDQAQKQIVGQIRKVIGPFATPSQIFIVDKLPKTRSGKTLRRLLTSLAEHKTVGDISTLENEEVVSNILKQMNKK